MQVATGLPQVPPTKSLPQLQAALCYGHNAMLLLVRQWILMKLDCSCDTVMNDVDFQVLLCRRTPRIVLLCQSLSSEEFSSASHFVAEHAPESLVVTFTRTERCASNKAHVLLTASDGLQVFSKTVSDLLDLQTLAGPGNLVC